MEVLCNGRVGDSLAELSGREVIELLGRYTFDKRWRMFSKMFMMNMLSKMIIYAKVCIITIFKPKRYQKNSNAFRYLINIREC